MLKTINKEKVKAVQLGGGPVLPAKGHRLFEEPYANIFLLAKKKSGKTTSIFHILKRCAGRNTKLVFMVSTIFKDDIYGEMIKHFKKKGNPIKLYTEIDDNIDEELIEDDEQKEGPDVPDFTSVMRFDKVPASPTCTRPSKYLTPEIIFILDDQGTALRSKSVSNLLKKNRHYKSKVILSSQYLNDMKPEALKQLDYMLVFKGQPMDKLILVHKHLDLSIPFSEFVKMYKRAVEDKFQFLYIDATNENFRQSFNKIFAK